jgi:hypothetical protein
MTADSPAITQTIVPMTTISDKSKSPTTTMTV